MTIEGVGPPLDDNGARGILAFEYLPDDLQRKEDGTAANDFDSQQFIYHVSERPATDTERLLLGEHLGYELPDELITVVEMLSPTIRRRTWPQLEGQVPTP